MAFVQIMEFEMESAEAVRLLEEYAEEGKGVSYARRAIIGHDRNRPGTIIQIIFSREPEAAKAWLERIYAWDFERVLPCHFDAPVEASPATVRKAFAFLE